MKLRCRELPLALAEILGEEATEEATRTVTAHLASCAACGGNADLNQVLSRIRAFAVPEPPAEYWDDFLPQLRRRIASATPDRRFPITLGFAAWLRPFATAAALAALTLPLLRAGHPALAPMPILGERHVADLADLAGAFDPLQGGDRIRLEELGAPVHESDSVSLGPGDLFRFLEAAETLTAGETEELLADLDASFPG